MCRLVDVEFLPRNVGAPAQGKADHTGTDRAVGQPIDQNEGAGPPVFLIGVEGNRLIKGDIAPADLVQMQVLAA